MASATYTVVKGDCLWNIAKAKLGDPYRWTEIADLNGISRDNPTIYPGQVLKLPTGSSSTTTTPNKSTKAKIEYFGLQAGTDTTMFVAWSWDRDNTESYKVKWCYATGDGLWFVGSETTVEHEDDPVSSYDGKQSTYSAPSNATKVKVNVKPISKKKKVNDTETSYWTAEWSTDKEYNFSNNPPKVPGVPDVKIEGYKLTASLSNLDVNGTHIVFQIVKNDSEIFKTGKPEIKTNAASWSCTVDAGAKYKVRAKSCRDNNLYSDWSEYSANVGTQPAASAGITVCRAESETSVYLEWKVVANAKTYDIEYTTKKEYFDGSDSTTTTTGIEYNHYIKTGLTSGQEYFFRVRAVNESGESGWTQPASVVIGTTPSAPTTWSSTTTGTVGEKVTFYWVHNSEDGSTQTYAEVEITIGGITETHTVNTVNEEDDEKTMFLEFNTSSYKEGTQILWRVRTAGATKTFGDWSVQRTIDIYAPPTLSISVTNANGNVLSRVTSFPIYIRGTAGPSTQKPISYHVSIISNSSYETVDSIGNPKTVIVGEQVYSKHFDTAEQLLLMISANHIDLENNVTYTVNGTVSMNSGLTATDSTEFTVSWEDVSYVPNAEIGINTEDLSASIRPYVEDENGAIVSGVSLAVYRREYDGSFVEIASGVSNGSNTYVTDPHPSLDYARYRIVATTDSTGAVSYYDVPGEPVLEKCIVIQWNEVWSNFDSSSEDAVVEPTWSGSMIKFPYNIDVSSKTARDISLVSYIGRKHPVTYYGTHLGETATWNSAIPKYDTETIYALRRLSVWMGDVYVREPTGSGYWANVNVTFPQKHRDLTIPITFDITRVEGGQ